MNDKWISSFLKWAGVILLVAALSRFLIAFGDAAFLGLPDPALGVPLRYAILTVGVIELVVALICLFGKETHLRAGWLAWCTTNYVVFLIGLFWMHCHSQATCIGSLTDPLRISRGWTGIITAFLPLFLAIGSYTAVIQLWVTGRASKPVEVVELIKMSCPVCAGHIKFAVQNLDEEIPCPHCQTTIALRRPENLKMSCRLCNGHIEFPAHAIGQKIACPHCTKPITLLNCPEL